MSNTNTSTDFEDNLNQSGVASPSRRKLLKKAAWMTPAVVSLGAFTAMNASASPCNQGEGGGSGQGCINGGGNGNGNSGGGG